MNIIKNAASMRPWRFATDNIDKDNAVTNLLKCFNEAVAFCHG